MDIICYPVDNRASVRILKTEGLWQDYWMT